MTKIILIDGDILAYSIGFSVESSFYVCNGKAYKTKGKAELQAKRTGGEIFKKDRKDILFSKQLIRQIEINLKCKLRSIFEDLGTRNYKMFITASRIEDNYRHKISTFIPYKAHRKDSRKPVHYDRVRSLLLDKYKAELILGQEADDAIGIMQYAISKKYNSFESTYIASIDKDLRMLEGHHYNLNKRNIEYINKEQALKNFYSQLLTGDPTDNIPGLAKLLKIHNREEEANKLIYQRPGYLKTWKEFMIDHTAKECYDYVIGLYKSHGFGLKEITEIGQLLWIRREEGELWKPKDI
jgi:hypothetical protein